MKIVIVSGFFNPLHGGHLDMIEAAAKMGDKLIVIVNNDVQQVMKKDKVILSEENRIRLIRALRDV
ncbi:MAG TPA: adenylyltransferase/cytidyltransferase family protein, partial [Candidatus Gracilibacteria bacterium]|nr:adenylyltransferase/cytidyltransferase family protein [Candidatus Gracilibacteria bacterium]